MLRLKGSRLNWCPFNIFGILFVSDEQCYHVEEIKLPLILHLFDSTDVVPSQTEILINESKKSNKKVMQTASDFHWRSTPLLMAMNLLAYDV